MAACLGTDDGIDEAVGAEQTTCFGWGTLLLAVIHGPQRRRPWDRPSRSNSGGDGGDGAIEQRHWAALKKSSRYWFFILSCCWMQRDDGRRELTAIRMQ